MKTWVMMTNKKLSAGKEAISSCRDKDKSNREGGCSSSSSSICISNKSRLLRKIPLIIFNI